MTNTRAAGERVYAAETRDLRLFIVAGEHSGDALGAKLMGALDQGRGGRIRYLGVGGPQMAAAGLSSQFPIEEVAVMGPLAILARLPTILRRITSTAAAAVASEPDAVVIIDSPEFTHPDCQTYPPPAPGHSHHRLRLTKCVGVASRARQQDARLRGSCAVLAPLRARGARPPAGTTLHLRGPSADRTPGVDQRRLIPCLWRDALA